MEEGAGGRSAAGRASHAAARRTKGLALIFATAAIWIVSSFLSASLVSSHDEHKAAVHPFLLTYLATALFTVYLPLHWLKDKLASVLAQYRRSNTVRRVGDRPEPPNKDVRGSFDGIEINTRAMEPAAARAMAMRAAAWCLPLWFTAQWSFNVSLSLTSVTSNTILSSTSSLFTFFLSIFLLGELFSSKKLIAIAACIAGTALVTLSDSASSDGVASLEGDLLTVCAAGIYAGYTVVMRMRMPGEEAEEHVAVFFGYLGLFSTLAFAPVVLLCTSAGVFSFASIPREAYAIIVLEGLLDYVLSDYLWARAVMLLGPTVATAGLSVQIPMAAVADVVLGNAVWIHALKTIMFTLGGTALILGGFFYINLIGSQADSETDLDTAGDPEDGSRLHEQQHLLNGQANGAVLRGVGQTHNTDGDDPG